MRVYNDILVAIDKRHCVMFLLLDLSSAFDTVDLDISLKDCTLFFQQMASYLPLLLSVALFLVEVPGLSPTFSFSLSFSFSIFQICGDDN